MEEKKYKTLPMVKRLMANTAERDKKQFGRIAVFTIAAAIYPFLGVFLPKIAIGILEQNKKDAGKTLLLAMAVYFVVAGILGFTVSYLRQVISVHNMRIRIHYLGDTFRKLTTMDYKYTENAKFFEENERA